MAKRFYSEVEAGTDLGIFDDPGIFNKTTDLGLLADVEEIQALADSIRTLLATCAGISLADYDTILADKFDMLSERLDYYDYSTVVKNTTVMDGAWFTPILVDSFCGEDGANVADNSIDGTNNTNWRHNFNHRHSIVYELRGYPKKIEKIRFRYGAGLLNREQLSNLDVRAARELSNIDEPSNLLESGINITWPLVGNVFVEHTLATKKNQGRYIKLEFDTAQGSNDMQMREFAVWVTTRNPDGSL